MSPSAPLGQLLHSFFADHLITVKGLRPSSVRSYRDTIRLLIVFLAANKRSKITRLNPMQGFCAETGVTSKTTAATTSAPATSGWR